MQRGKVRTSTIFIATGATTRVYRDLDEVPPALRKELVKSTESPNAGLVVIADPRGVRELLRGRLDAKAAERRHIAGPLSARAGMLLRLAAAHWMELTFSGAAGLLLWILLST
jgi:hypothetical protein